MEVQVDESLEVDGIVIADAVRFYKNNFVVFSRIFGFNNHVAEFKKIGTITAQVVELEANVQLLQELRVYKTYFSGEEYIAGDLPEDRQAFISSLLLDTTSFENNYHMLYFGNTLAAAKSTKVLLEAKASGGSDGASWRDTCTTGVWTHFLEVTEPTLRAVNKLELLGLIRDCDVVSYYCY